MARKKNKDEDIVDGEWRPADDNPYAVERTIQAGNLTIYLNDDQKTFRHGYTDGIYGGLACEDVVDALGRELHPDMLTRLFAHLLVLAKNGSPAALLLVDRMMMPARLPIIKETMVSLTENILGLQSTPKAKGEPMLRRIGSEFMRQVIGV